MIFRSCCCKPKNTFREGPSGTFPIHRSTLTLQKSPWKELDHSNWVLAGGRGSPAAQSGQSSPKDPGEASAPTLHPWGAAAGPDAAPGEPSPCGSGAQPATGRCPAVQPHGATMQGCGGVGSCGWTRRRSRSSRAASVWRERMVHGGSPRRRQARPAAMAFAAGGRTARARGRGSALAGQ
jgi:hypothetical protein